ncbi:hypothetical protein RHMOL_Rhmol13G0180500 [Rhododendron molle]|uniref:Uncharacterized protein n=1 Tax=Rhododendron molle TaxID=49168 RepID=A0ACC0L7Y9_RHOML|nr:hypothetical protein RHMOL_Rhmol13G0180500 [Rhododendron molle]
MIGLLLIVFVCRIPVGGLSEISFRRGTGSSLSPVGWIPTAGCYFWERPDRFNGKAGSSGGPYGGGRRCG